MSPDFQKGAAAIDKAAERRQGSGGGNRPAVVPQLFWRQDQEEKYLKFLVPMSEIPTVLKYHEWVPVTFEDGTERRNEHFISRKDECIGETYDDLEERLGHQPKARTLAVAVELEPEMEVKGGRQKPKSFKVKTNEFNETQYPAIGLITQSPQNFFGYLSNYDLTEGPIHEDVVFKVTRRGTGPETAYDFIPMEGKPVDLSGLTEHIDNVRYLAEDLEDDKSPETIAETLLNKRLDELADGERYRKLVSPIQEIKTPFGGGSSIGNGNQDKAFQDLRARINAGKGAE